MRSTDWTKLYLQVQSFSVSDPLFWAANFHKLPTLFLWDCLNHLGEIERNRINASSITSSKLGMVVVGALGGKGNKAKLQDFLPYQMPRDENGLKETTVNAIKWALKNEKMPPAIVGILGSELA